MNVIPRSWNLKACIKIKRQGDIWLKAPGTDVSEMLNLFDLTSPRLQPCTVQLCPGDRCVGLNAFGPWSKCNCLFSSSVFFGATVAILVSYLDISYTQ